MFQATENFEYTVSVIKHSGCMMNIASNCLYPWANFQWVMERGLQPASLVDAERLMKQFSLVSPRSQVMFCWSMNPIGYGDKKKESDRSMTVSACNNIFLFHVGRILKWSKLWNSSNLPRYERSIIIGPYCLYTRCVLDIIQNSRLFWQ